MLVTTTEITGPAAAIEPLVAAGALLLLAGVIVAALARRRARARDRNGRASASVPPAAERPAATQTPHGPVTANPPRQSAPEATPERATPAWTVAPDPGPRQLLDETVTRFGRALERSRRLRAAEDRMAHELGDLAGGHWLVERYVLLGSQRVPFVIVGPTGVFLMVATDGAWDVRDLVALSRLKPAAEHLLPGYRGDVHAGVCMVFDRMEPRKWHGGLAVEGHGGWVLGLDWLMRWLHSFDSAHGPDTGDIAALVTAAAPVWRRRAKARLPVVRNFG